MTTIAIDFKGKKLYTDSRATQSNRYRRRISILGFEICKWGKLPDAVDDTFCKTFASNSPDEVITGSGTVPDIEAFIATYNKGAPDYKLLGNSAVTVITTAPTFKVQQHRSVGVMTFPDDSTYLTYGSGGDYCAGAFEGNGGDMVSAIGAAKSLDRLSGGDIISVDLSGRSFNEDIY